MLKAILYLRSRTFKNNFIIMLIMVGLGLFLTAIFGTSMGGDYHPPVYIVDLDQSTSSELFIQQLLEHDIFEFHSSDEDKALSQVKNNQAVAAVVIKDEFGENLKQGKEVRVELIKQKDVVETIQLNNLLQSTMQLTASRIQLMKTLYEFIGDTNDIEEESFNSQLIDNYKLYNVRQRHLQSFNSDVITSSDKVSNNSYDNLIHTLIGFTLFFSTFPIVYNIADILSDKKKYTFNRIMISPVSKDIYLAGNMIFTVFQGIIQITILVLAGKYLFNVDWGNQLPLILLVFFTFILAMTCLGLFLSGLVKTYSQLSAITPIVLTSLGMLGGCMWPLEIVTNKVLLTLSNITPHKWALNSIKMLVMNDHGAIEAYQAIAVMLLMSCLFFMVGRRVLRTE
ncbi:ABC transporter permease [Vallitalea okinawensis]|uniref:ABC transporter permease n=1 Tax=Vallitalea okinawensis TaxID=2078660 RepID=UPI000CFC0D0F|nr:ABC transporter permease [Vallitalea okinawensis]